MAQTIKIKRGGYGSISSLGGTNAGEIALLTGSASDIANFPEAFSILLANNGSSWDVPLAGVVTGSGAPGTPSDAKLNGILYFDTSGNKFYRLDSTGNQELDLAASTAGNLTDGNGIIDFTFDGGSNATISVDSGSLAGNGLTTDDSSGTFVVQATNDTITVASTGISVNTGSIANGANNLVDSNTINSLSSSIASDIAGIQSGDITITVQAGTLAALSAGNGLTSTDDYDGSSAESFAVQATNNTITVASTGISVNTGSIDINNLDQILTVANGGTGVASLTDNGVLVGSGTDTITALTPGTNGQLLIGASSADPAFQTVTGVITIDETGLTDFSAGGASAISGSFTSVSASIATDIVSLAADIVTNAGDIITLQNDSGTTTNALTDGDGIQDFTFDGSAGSVVVAVEAAQTTITSIKNDSLVIGRNDGGNDLIDFGTAGEVLIKTNNTERLSATDNGVDITGALTVSGDLTVSGTTTTVNSTTVEIGDNIIVLNSANTAADAGIYVIDNDSVGVTGSLVYNYDSNYWMAGEQASEKRIATFEADNPTNSGFIHLNDSDRIVSVASGSTVGAFLQKTAGGFEVSAVIDGGTY